MASSPRLVGEGQGCVSRTPPLGAPFPPMYGAGAVQQAICHNESQVFQGGKEPRCPRGYWAEVKHETLKYCLNRTKKINFLAGWSCFRV